MINAKKLMKLDWQPNREKRTNVAKGHFAVYTTDCRRFVVPLAYLNNCIFTELLNLSEDEFGLTSDGPITLPCDSVFMKFLISLVESGGSKNSEKDLLCLIINRRWSLASLQLARSNHRLLVNGF